MSSKREKAKCAAQKIRSSVWWSCLSITYWSNSEDTFSTNHRHPKLFPSPCGPFPLLLIQNLSYGRNLNTPLISSNSSYQRQKELASFVVIYLKFDTVVNFLPNLMTKETNSILPLHIFKTLYGQHHRLLSTTLLSQRVLKNRLILSFKGFWHFILSNILIIVKAIRSLLYNFYLFYIWHMPTFVSRRVKILCIKLMGLIVMLKYCLPSYIWGLAFYSHVKNICPHHFTKRGGGLKLA